MSTLTNVRFSCVAVSRKNQSNIFAGVAQSGLPENVPLTFTLSSKIVDSILSQEHIEKQRFGDVFQSTTLSKWNQFFVEQLETVMIATFKVGDQTGMIALFWDKSHPVNIEDNDIETILRNISILLNVTTSRIYILSKYQNEVRKIQRERDHVKEETESWFEQVLHQITNPLNALIANADTMLAKFEKWNSTKREMFEYWIPEDKDWIQYRLQEIVSHSLLVHQIADDCAWDMIYEHDQKQERVSFTRMQNIAGLLIETVRHYQPMATAKGIRTIGVDTPSFSVLDGRLKINQKIFQEAMGNIIHNAVKYSYSNTEIWIRGSLRAHEAIISISNIGIQLPPEDVDRIFESKYRSAEAKNYHAPGMGIGLAVALEKIELHGGDIRVSPSTMEGLGWRTVFEVVLPV